ncbi:hypothetical protein Pst134EA_032467 [Puccinia striiformis f. sp. tritici]|uniref:uncharacterized protein n=1 Tax=Puccinia striiformis f. sp. tritici TaxID=168172 RepID=UPI002008C256|nr:uncharacterized protein Pst134EA_032467 [Puccinia striiformis f. sp. tritici]KAH9444239.1 hypothetical protein Pst134EA_032467 [Puccinia striiformis f. sp. tritici]
MPPKKSPNIRLYLRPRREIDLWDRDGVNGGPSSIEIILRWITTGKKLPKWRGDKEEGKSKVRLLTEINKLMNKWESSHREAKGIRQKNWRASKIIQQSSYFLKNTVRILAEDEENGVYTVEQKIQEECPWIGTQLDPIMGDRSVLNLSMSGQPLGINLDDFLLLRRIMPFKKIQNNVIVEDHQPDKDDDSEGSQLPDIDLRFIESTCSRYRSSASPDPFHPSLPLRHLPKRNSRKRTYQQSVLPRGLSARASRIKKKMTTEDLYMKSIVSKRQSKVTRARGAEASKVKVAFMKGACEHGLSLAEIECKVNAEFPPLADMYHDKGDESTNDLTILSGRSSN